MARKKPKNWVELKADIFDEEVDGSEQRTPVVRRWPRGGKPSATIGPWGRTSSKAPLIYRNIDAEEYGDEDAAEVEGYTTPSNPKHGLSWFFFRAPGALILWWQYYMPQRGRVLISARQKGHVFFEVLLSVVFWIGLVIVGLSYLRA